MYVMIYLSEDKSEDGMWAAAHIIHVGGRCCSVGITLADQVINIIVVHN